MHKIIVEQFGFVIKLWLFFVLYPLISGTISGTVSFILNSDELSIANTFASKLKV